MTNKTFQKNRKHLVILIVYPCTAILNLCFQQCGESNFTQKKEDEEQHFYTQNNYRLPNYTIQEYKELFTLTDAREIRKITQKLINQWNCTGTETKPHELLEAFVTEQLTPLIETVPSLKNYYDQLGKVLQKPTEENKQKLIEIAQKLETNKTIQHTLIARYFHKQCNPDALILTQKWLAYQECLNFLCGHTDTLHHTLKVYHTNLATWKQEGHPTGLTLWNNIQDSCKHELLQKAQTKNRKAIEDSLQIMDQLAESPYGLSYRAFQETLPHGIALLTIILTDSSIKENKHATLLHRYCKQLLIM